MSKRRPTRDRVTLVLLPRADKPAGSCTCTPLRLELSHPCSLGQVWLIHASHCASPESEHEQRVA